MHLLKRITAMKGMHTTQLPVPTEIPEDLPTTATAHVVPKIEQVLSDARPAINDAFAFGADESAWLASSLRRIFEVLRDD
jgi:hypothetical protein